MKCVCDLSKQTYTDFKLSIYEGMGFQQAELGDQLYSLCQPFNAVVSMSPLHHHRLKSIR